MGKTLPENSSRNFITVLRAARTSKSRYLQNTKRLQVYNSKQ